MKKQIFPLFLLSLALTSILLFLKFQSLPQKEKSIVVVIPSYNNIKWYKRNLNMLFAQEKFYKNWRAIYIDDHSQDGTADAVERFIKYNGFENKIKLIKNKKRVRQLANVYKAVHSCKNEEIIVICDGDDWFNDEKVLHYINSVYQDPNVWMTYGQYKRYPSGQIGHCQEIPAIVTKNNHFRKYKWVSSHLRTFYAKLFKKIQNEDLLYNGEFLHAATDMAAMFPMLEMSGNHAKFIPKPLYIYNQDNPINIYKKNIKMVLHLDKFVRNKKKYDRIEHLIT